MKLLKMFVLCCFVFVFSGSLLTGGIDYTSNIRIWWPQVSDVKFYESVSSMELLVDYEDVPLSQTFLELLYTKTGYTLEKIVDYYPFVCGISVSVRNSLKFEKNRKIEIYYLETSKEAVMASDLKQGKYSDVIKYHFSPRIHPELENSPSL